MSREVIEELKGEIRAALQGLSEEESLLPIVIGKKCETPSQAVKASKIAGLSSKQEEIARKVARLRKMVLEKDPSADFSKVLEDLRKSKEFEMDKKEIIKKVQEWMKKYDISLKEVLTPIEPRKAQVVVMKDPVEVASDLKNDLRYDFIERVKPIIKEYGWELLYGDSLIGIDYSGGCSFGMNYDLVHEKQIVILSFSQVSSLGTFKGLPKERSKLLPIIKEFAREVAEKTGYRVEIHK